MQKQKTFPIGDKSFTAYELSAKEIKQITDTFETDSGVNILDMLFPEARVPGQAIWLSMKMTEEELLAYPPSEIELMIPEVETLNPTLAGLVKRLAEIGKAFLAKKSAEQSAS